MRILKLIFKEIRIDWRAWIGFACLSMENSGWLLWALRFIFRLFKNADNLLTC